MQRDGVRRLTFRFQRGDERRLMAVADESELGAWGAVEQPTNLSLSRGMKAVAVPGDSKK
jgi:hypothetical protein